MSEESGERRTGKEKGACLVGVVVVEGLQPPIQCRKGGSVVLHPPPARKKVTEDNDKGQRRKANGCGSVKDETRPFLGLLIINNLQNSPPKEKIENYTAGLEDYNCEDCANAECSDIFVKRRKWNKSGSI